MEALAEELEGDLKVLNEAGLTILLRFAPYRRLQLFTESGDPNYEIS